MEFPSCEQCDRTLERGLSFCSHCWNSLGDKLQAAQLQIEELQYLLHRTIEWGSHPFNHIKKCPEDDTCRCPEIKRLNDAMKGFMEKPKYVPPVCCCDKVPTMGGYCQVHPDLKRVDGLSKLDPSAKIGEGCPNCCRPVLRCVCNRPVIDPRLTL
jgi:hypothetical protein